jgi:effector-binding domain-containing protein
VRWLRAGAISLLAVGWPVAVAAADEAQVGQAGEQAASAQADNTPQVQLKNLGRTRVIYLEHQGPYWQVGRLFAQVAEFMAEHDQAGPMFGRYLDDPQKVEVQRLRAEVGFVVGGDLEPPEPYQVKDLPARTVASLLVRGHYGQAPASYPTVFAWINEHGYLAEPAVTEIYLVSPDGGPAAKRMTEIQVTLAGAAEVAPPRTVQRRPQPRRHRPTDFRAFARRLIPPKVVFPELLRDWMAQLVLRIEAIQRVAAAGSGEGKSAFDAYAGPIVARSRWLVEGAQARSDVAPPRFTSEAALGGRQADADRLLSRLDTVLVNLTLGYMASDAALNQVVELTSWVPELVEESSRLGSHR